MLKLTCSFMALVLILSILYLNKVESRVRFQNLEGIPASQLHHLRYAMRHVKRENSNENQQDGSEHVKRKSDFLLSLYGLPYTLIDKREVD